MQKLQTTQIVDLFLRIGLDAKTANNTVANNKVTANLTAVIKEAAVTGDGCSKAVGNLLYTVATKFPANALVHRPTLLEFIVSNKIKSPAQLEAAHAYLGRLGSENLQLNEFEEACGVGVEVSLEEIEYTVSMVFEEKRDAILEMRYRVNVGELFARIFATHPWADARFERTAADNEKPIKKKKEKKLSKEDVKVIAVQTPEEEVNPFTIFPGPEENTKVHTEILFSNRPVLRASNTKEMLKKHMEMTGGRVFTRFPPEPNGYLHIGHAKAMFINFGLAKERGGCCNLRYDDTNPDAEKKEYIDHIREIVQWMGWEPFKITYTSDYFHVLYELAVELIKKGHAYVDHQSAEEIKVSSENKRNSPWRDRPIEESLKLFNDMRMGLIEENKATLRMKQDMQSDNFNMYDLIAYRIKFTPHPRAGDEWCIYPSYDYAHCIVDSLENITHSLCTLEFETRRASYYWLLDALSRYQPYVWEYSRLNITNTVMSKRNWFTATGVSATAINTFIRGVGITRSDNSTIRLDRLEYHIREDLNKTAARQMVVLHPLKVVITNLDDKTVLNLDAKKWPDAQTDDASAIYKVPFTNVVYIERSDFRAKDSKDYYGLAPGKSKQSDGETVMEIRAEYNLSNNTKPKGVLHWVSQPSPGVDPLRVEVRLFDKLFVSENPAELEEYLTDLNPESKEVIPEAFGVSSLRDAAVGDKFQFERLGYFAVDLDSTQEKLVFNRTVTLRDSYSKGGNKE
ncbi:hypothetical protein MKW98_004265 [Papaver atlanticum]|uniref:glutamine--tRNA ligase n=1 Tax=Papaver atlanticum TaxID=357466 RepID=A0AAD4T8X1_9MAGN|nr:hypothetical protein MKW98_004265 [Papaver atlanticum]